MKRWLLLFGLLMLATLSSVRGRADVAVYVGYYENKTSVQFMPDPYIGGAGTAFLGAQNTQNDTGLILIRNTGATLVTLGKGSFVDGFANSAKFQLWDTLIGTGVTIKPGYNLILAATAAGNFITSDQPLISDPTKRSAAIPNVHLVLNGTMQVFKDSAQVLNTGGFDTEAAYQRNKSLQWRPIGTTGIENPAGYPVVPTDIVTQRFDNTRSSCNTLETCLGPANVGANTFGKLFSYPVDGQVYAQPLYLSNFAVTNGNFHNIVYVATEHNSVYAFDADNNTGANSAPLWHVNLGPSVPSNNLGCGDLTPEVGITSTPVIDRNLKTIFVVTKTFENNQYLYKLHALYLTNGKERPGSPVLLQATVAGTGDGGTTVSYQGQYVHQRSALLEVNGTIYVLSASHCDYTPYHGWVLGYNASTLKQTAVFNTTPDGGLGGIWMAGAGPCADTQGNLYFATGNGTFDANTTSRNYGDTIMKLGTQNGFSVMSYFTPYNQADLSNSDADLGSGGVMLLPDQIGTKAHPHLMVAAGKQGTVYLLDRDNMGGYNATTQDDNQIVQALPGAVGYTLSSPAYFHGNIYYNSSWDVMRMFTLKPGKIISTPVSQSNTWFDFPGATPWITANVITKPLVWAIQNSGGNAVLHVLDANNIGNEFYNSANQSGRDDLDGYVKFNNPIAVNGKVYVPTTDSLTVFGSGFWATPPVISPLSTQSTKPITISMSSVANATIYYTLDGSAPTTQSAVYSKPIVISSSAVVKAISVVSNFRPSAAATASYLIGDAPGNGDGLSAIYFSNMTLDGTKGTVVKEVDPTVNFNWNGNPPVNGIPATQWSARWTGFVLARSTGTYTFTTNSDDGTRLWVNGQEIINDWTDHAPTFDSGSISLVRGQKVSIKLEYYQNGGGSLMQLYWSALGLSQQIIPQNQLFSH